MFDTDFLRKYIEHETSKAKDEMSICDQDYEGGQYRELLGRVKALRDVSGIIWLCEDTGKTTDEKLAEYRNEVDYNAV